MALSPATESSFDMISSCSSIATLSSPSRDHDDDASSDDEIVWGVSPSETSASDISLGSPYTSGDEDFVVLSQLVSPASANGPSVSNPDGRAQSPNSITDHDALCVQVKRLSIGNQGSPSSDKQSSNGRRGKRGPTSRRGKARGKGKPAPAPAPATPSPKPAFSTKRLPLKEIEPVGLGSRPIVDDVSEISSEYGDNVVALGYDYAVQFIDSFLSDSTPKDRDTRLTLLQSLIIELGLLADYNPLPASLTAATALIKSRAFLNVGEYLAVRSQGQVALQRAMYPSRSALIKAIRRNRDAKTPLRLVKDSGLQVFLVTCYR